MTRILQILTLGIALFIFSCGSESNNDISFNELSGKAILIGDNIQLLDSALNLDSTVKEGTIVDLKGITDSLYQETNDYCDAFRYVKIESDFTNRVVNGRNVYQIKNSDQNISSFQYKKKDYELMTTSFFGIGVSDDDGLTFCSKYFEPVVIMEKKSQNPRLVNLQKNDISRKASLNGDFTYLEFMANDGAYDTIEKIEQIENGILVTIRREFQEGWNRFQVKLIMDKPDFYAEFLSYEDVQY